MRIRNQLVGLLVGVLALGAAVAMFPSGASGGQVTAAAGKPTTTTTTTAPPSVRCTDAKKLQSDELAIIGSKGLPRATLTSYKAKLQELVNVACSATGTCPQMTGLVADLVTIRGTTLGATKNAQLTALESTFLTKHCGS